MKGRKFDGALIGILVCAVLVYYLTGLWRLTFVEAQETSESTPLVVINTSEIEALIQAGRDKSQEIDVAVESLRRSALDLLAAAQTLDLTARRVITLLGEEQGSPGESVPPPAESGESLQPESTPLPGPEKEPAEISSDADKCKTP